jgi:hypothetical protein
MLSKKQKNNIYALGHNQFPECEVKYQVNFLRTICVYTSLKLFEIKESLLYVFSPC